MVPSGGIKLLKYEDPDRSKRVSDWKKEVCKPITETEIQQLQKICESIDFYGFRILRISEETKPSNQK